MEGKMSFAEYFYNVAPEALRQYRELAQQRREKPSACPHHRVPPDRAVPLWKPSEPAFRDRRFWYSWYLVDLLDQGIHHYFFDQYARWVRSTGSGYPIPMTPAGMGCWTVASPSRILGGVRFVEAEWDEVCRFFLEESKKLWKMAGVQPHEFFEKLLQDREFDQGNPHEAALAGHIRGFFVGA